MKKGIKITSINTKKLIALLMSGVILTTAVGCRSNNENTKSNETDTEAAVFFVNGKALIYEEESDRDIFITRYGSSIESTWDILLTFSSGVEAVKVNSIEDAIEFAEAMVGEENIIYINLEDKDMQLTDVKTR